MKTSSCKAKGRRAAAQVKELILKYFPELEQDDVLVTPSGVTGPDLSLSPKAKSLVPLVIECKNVEALNVWAALTQAESHKKQADLMSVLFFKRNKSKLYAALDAEELLALLYMASHYEHDAET